MGTLREPVPVAGLTENFSSIPLIAPPPLGREMAGAENGVCWGVASPESPGLLSVSGVWLLSIGASLSKKEERGCTLACRKGKAIS
jgi:hypothetical protein